MKPFLPIGLGTFIQYKQQAIEVERLPVELFTDGWWAGQQMRPATQALAGPERSG